MPFSSNSAAIIPVVVVAVVVVVVVVVVVIVVASSPRSKSVEGFPNFVSIGSSPAFLFCCWFSTISEVEAISFLRIVSSIPASSLASLSIFRCSSTFTTDASSTCVFVFVVVVVITGAVFCSADVINAAATMMLF
jgi:hypothetical protein